MGWHGGAGGETSSAIDFLFLHPKLLPVCSLHHLRLRGISKKKCTEREREIAAEQGSKDINFRHKMTMVIVQ